MILKQWMLFGFLAAMASAPVIAQNLSITKQLMSDIFGDYDRRVRPINDQTQPVDVWVGYTIFTLNEVDDIDEKMTTTAYLSLYWVDEDLAWNASDYDNVTMLTVPQTDIWHPDIALKNAVGKNDKMGDDSLLVFLYNTGDIYWYPFERFQSSCSIDVRYYPFDKQTCTQTFAAWSYSRDEVEFKDWYSYVDLVQYTESATWAIEDTHTVNITTEFEPTMEFTFHLRRKPLFTVLNMLLPIMFLAILALLVFILPVSSGEKVGYSITVFLAFAVFLTIIQDIMPRNSDSVALLNLYCTLLTASSSVICVFAILMTKVLDMPGLHVPKFFVWLSMIGTLSFKRLIKKGKPKSTKVNSLSLTDHEEEADMGMKKNIPPSRPSSCSSNSSNSSVDSKKKKKEKPTWASIMHGLEMFCLYLWTFIFIMLTLVIIVGSYTHAI